MTISLFIILEMAQLKFLTLEVRTYAAFVLFTMLTIYTALRAVARPHWIRLISTALASCMLVSSHTFGIVYAVSIASCAVAAAAIEGKVRVAFKLGLTSVPAIVMFCLWVPILKQQAQLGNWIPRPDLPRLLDSTYPPSNSLRLEGIAIILALVILIWPRTQNSYGTVARRQWWRATNGIYIFAIAIPIAFGSSTFVVWLFSRNVFQVFLERYFFPNLVLHTIWLSMLVNWVFIHLPTSKKNGLVLAAAVLAGLSIKPRQIEPETRIPCFDPSQSAYMEDPFRDYGPIVGLTSHPFLTRLNHPGEPVLFPVDKDALKKNGTEYPPYVYHYLLVKRFAEWLGVNALMSTSELLNTKPGFVVLDDRQGPWLEHVKLNHRIKLIPLAETKSCTVWQVEAVE